jgi:acyl carrier protein
MTKDRVLKCLENVGLLIDSESEEQLIEIVDDSILFISFVVELEEEFGVEIPDELLTMECFRNTHELCILLENLVGGLVNSERR